MYSLHDLREARLCNASFTTVAARYSKFKGKEYEPSSTCHKDAPYLLQKKDLAKFQPTSNCSVFVDGADQSAFDLPHFVTFTEDDQRTILWI